MSTTNPSEGQPTGTTSELESESPGWTPERLEKFWTAMRQLYGRRWIHDHGETISDNLAWLKALESMTPDEAALGYRACQQSDDAYSPTLPQFLTRVADQLKSRGPHLGQRPSPEVEEMHRKSRARAARELPPPDEASMERLRGAGNLGEAALWEMRGLLK